LKLKIKTAKSDKYCPIIFIIWIVNKNKDFKRGEYYMKSVVFLDVDGVLNTRTTVKRTPYGYTGIDDARVKILANAFKRYGYDEIILSSDWKELDEKHMDYLYLVSKLGQCGLKISGHTPGSSRKRGKGINEYLNLHPEIEEFVILDDVTFDFGKYEKLWERLLITNGIENVRFASRTPAVEAILFLDYIKNFNIN